MDIFERMRAGEIIRLDDPDYQKVQQQINWIFTKTIELNKLPYDLPLIREKAGEMLGIKIDDSTTRSINVHPILIKTFLPIVVNFPQSV